MSVCVVDRISVNGSSCLSLSLCISLSLCLFLYLSQSLSVSLCVSVCLSVCVCVCMYVYLCLFVCLSVCLFVCLPFSRSCPEMVLRGCQDVKIQVLTNFSRPIATSHSVCPSHPLSLRLSVSVFVCLSVRPTLALPPAVHTLETKTPSAMQGWQSVDGNALLLELNIETRDRTEPEGVIN